jgi:hypothetical protein
MCPYRVFVGLCCPSCLFSSMSWVSSSTTACATTLVARAARAAGLAGPAVVELSMSSSRRSMRRESICVLRHVVNTEIVKCFKYWVVKRHCRQLLGL